MSLRRQSIIEHYGVRDLREGVTAALRRAGMDPDHIAWESLAPLDQFHVGGLAPTAALGEALGLQQGSRVLDVGCGLGGPARYLAATCGCAVTGIDLSRPYVDLAALLNRGAGLSERVAVVQADACRLPFPPEQFDAAITQHVAMSIEDKGAFYSGIHAALRPGGLLGLYDVIATGAGALEFPLPWARRPEDSFVLDAAGLRAALVRAGFIVRDWVDRTQDAQAWFAGQAAARAAGAPEPALSLSLVMGPGFASMAANLARNLAQGRVRLVQVIAQRPR